MRIKFSGLLFFLLFLFVISINCKAQTWTWAKSWGMLTVDATNTRAINVDPSGNVFTAGIYRGSMTVGIFTLTCPPTVNGACSFLKKYDNSGNVVWAKSGASVCSPTFSYTSVGLSVCTDADGNSFITGACGSSSKSTVYLAKYDPFGTLLWGQSALSNNNEIGFSVTCDSSKNVYMSGVFTSSVVFGQDTLLGSGPKNLFLVKYDANGNQIWSRSNSSGTVFHDIPNTIGVAVSAEPNGDVFMTGAFMGPSMVLGTQTLTGNSGSSNVFVAKYDASGNVLWARSALATTTNNIASSVSADKTGNVYIAGYYTSFNLNFGTNIITNTGLTQNMFLAKYDGSGNNLWVKNSRNNAYDEKGYSVVSNSTTVFLAGTTASVLTIGTNVFSPTSSSLGENGFITKFDVNGNLLYGETLDDGGISWFTVGADKYCDAYVAGDFTLKPLVIGTHSLMAVPLISSNNPLVAKLSFSGTCLTGTGTTEKSRLQIQSNLFPNPNKGSFIFEIEEEIEDGKFIMFNSISQKVHEQKISKGENKIVVNYISTGLYHYVISENKHMILNGKFVLE